MNYDWNMRLATSLLLFLDYRTVAEGQAFTNITGLLLPQTDPKYQLQGYTIYSSPNYQWVMDSSISGAVIPTGFYIGQNLIGRGASGVAIDFRNGRVFISGNSNASNVSGVYAQKDINYYLGTENDTQLRLNRALNGENIFVSGYPAPRQYIAPCVILSPLNEQNFPFALGGAKRKRFNFSATIISDNNVKLYGCKNIIVDSVDRCMPVLMDSDIPYNYYGDIKNGYYNYTGLVYNYRNNSTNRAYISEIKMNNLELFRGKVGNFQEFFVNYGIISVDVFNYFTPGIPPNP